MTNALFPFVLTQDHVAAADPETLRPLGHGLTLGLVVEGDGAVHGVRAAALRDEGLTVDAAYEAAARNLHQTLRSGAMTVQAYQGGPGGQPFAVFGGHWAAASCIAYPGLRQAMSRALGADDLLVAIPHRGVLLAFPDRDEASRAAVHEFVGANEGAGEDPLTLELFAVDGDGVHAV